MWMRGKEEETEGRSQRQHGWLKAVQKSTTDEDVVKTGHYGRGNWNNNKYFQGVGKHCFAMKFQNTWSKDAKDRTKNDSVLALVCEDSSETCYDMIFLQTRTPAQLWKRM